jgi:hypothetical protein
MSYVVERSAAAASRCAQGTVAARQVAQDVQRLVGNGVRHA